jgi:predicted dehydrogenase/threonine dehydrogenase-like Zn-dependent dehydrogenase
MKQIIQHLKNGETELIEVPAPQCKPGCILIQTTTTLISAGTERMLVKFGKSSYLQKAKSQPDKVKQVLNKVKTDGLMQTIDAVKSKLDQPLPLGYCNVGVVLEVGAGVTGFKPGDRVVSNGAHAEVVCVAKNLCALIPGGVTDEEAAYTVMGSIALQGIRLAGPTLGETIVVMGLGLVGLMAVQQLLANGCKVIGTDFNSARCDLAKSFGAAVVCLGQGEDAVVIAEKLTHGRGVDAVVITASTDSSEPIHQAAQMCRKRGRIVMVGVTGMELSRADFYEKELSFQVSCSYGPGRYDSNYEDRGHDYPLGFVRWTQQRNFEAVLGLMESQKIVMKTMTTHRYSFDEAIDAYKTLEKNADALGILMNYPDVCTEALTSRVVNISPNVTSQSVSLAFIGAGNFASRTLIPAFKTTDAQLHTIVSAQGLSGTLQAKKQGFINSSTDFNAVLHDPSVDALVIATRHNAHADQVIAALEAGKHVFVEKPLAIDHEGLERIKACYEALQRKPMLMVGFNRRFSPQVQLIKKQITPGLAPISMVMQVNAGHIPDNHWTQDMAVGGGRLIGEGCHFIDLLRYLADAPIVKSSIVYLGKTPAKDSFSISLEFENGSIGTIHYFANGHASISKERLEVFSSGGVLQLDNFRTLTGVGIKGFKKNKAPRQDKGHAGEAQAFVEAVKSGVAPIDFSELLEVATLSIDLNSLS